MLILVFLPTFGVLQDGAIPPLLRPEETIRGEITEGAAGIHTPTLDASYLDATTVGLRYGVEVQEAGVYHVELRSYSFDAYLVLRDALGNVIVEDDDGFIALNSRIVTEFVPSQGAFLEACALHGQRGAFELTMRPGKPAELSPLERAELEREDAEHRVAVVEGTFGPAHPQVATSLTSVAALLRAQGDYNAARSLFERALAICEKALGPEHLDTAQCLNNLAVVLLDLGDYTAARPLLERALALDEKILGLDHPQTAVNLSNLATVLQELGNYEAAKPLLERALAIRERVGPEHPYTADSLNNLGILLYRLGDYTAARPLLERALAIGEKILGPDHPNTARSLTELANLLRTLGDYDGAQPLLERALAIAEHVLGPAHPHTADSLNNLGLLLYDQRDYAAARSFFERALTIRERVLGPEHRTTAATLNNLATTLQALNEYVHARPLYERALSIRERVLGPEHRDTARSLNSLALLLADSGEPVLAWDLARRTEASLARVRRLLCSLSEGESYRYLASVRWQLETQLSLAPLVGGSEARFEAYQSLVAWKGQVGRLLVSSHVHLLSSLGDEERVLVDKLRSCQGELSRLAFAREIPDRARHEARFAELEKERNRLEVELRRMEKGSVPETAAFGELRSRLPERSAFVDFFVHPVYRPARREGEMVVEKGHWSEPRVSVWITRASSPEGTPVHLDLGHASELEASVKDFLEDLVLHRGVGRVGRPEQGESLASQLREKLWIPLLPYLDGVNTLFVSPDGFLGALPLEVIPDERGSFLVERYAFVYTEIAGLPAGLKEDAKRDDGSLLSVGGVDFTARSELELEVPALAISASAKSRGGFTDYWAKLPQTAYESQVVNDLFEASHGGHATLIQGAEATEERLKRELPKHSVLHLATHGFFNPVGLPSLWDAALTEAQKVGEGALQLGDEERALAGRAPGLLSGLVFAGANTPAPEGREDGYLTAEEVGWLDLSRVELVALSACETGLGRPQSGEGMLGLRRAFHTAGARTVVSSLWSVRDESTGQLMQRFYENLWIKGMGRAEALRAAQLEMLAKNRAQDHDALPSTWGAFVLSGEWQ